jgi:hypothetical protein
MRPFLSAFAHLGGARDTFAVNALDASGRGLWLGAPMRSTKLVSDDDKTLFSRLASHLTSAIRLRRGTEAGAVRPAAVMSTTGALRHAEDDEVVERRDDLRRAAGGRWWPRAGRCSTSSTPTASGSSARSTTARRRARRAAR